MSSLSVQELVAQFGAHVSLGSTETRPPVLSIGWGELDAVLPDGGLPRGVVELRAPHRLGGSTSVALAAIRAAQTVDKSAWAGWIDPEGTLFAPGVALAEVDTSRLLVVRPPRERLLRTAIAVTRASAFNVIVIDLDGGETARPLPTSKLEPFVRKLAMLAGEAGATVLLLTDASIARAAPLPVAMRLELSRNMEALTIRVAKERHGRVGNAKSISFDSRPRLTFTV